MIYDSYQHALYNREVSLLLMKAQKFDWVTVTAFYSGIHLLYSSLFPLSIQHQGKVLRVSNFNDYCRIANPYNDTGKHEMLGRLVKASPLTPQARRAYEMLKGESFTARYTNCQVTHSMASKSISRLSLLQQECERLKIA